MSRHWKPDEQVVQPLSRARRLKSLVEFRLRDFVGRMERMRRRHRLPEGAIAGLMLVAAACVGVAVGAYAVFGPRHLIVDELRADR
jgi:hypothetical protein